MHQDMVHEANPVKIRRKRIPEGSREFRRPRGKHGLGLF